MKKMGGKIPPILQKLQFLHAKEQQGFDLDRILLDRILRQKKHEIFQPVIFSIIAKIFLKSINKFFLLTRE